MDQGLKQNLLEVVRDARAREQEIVDAATEMPADRGGRWHAKDQLAHLAWWRDRDGRLIDAVRSGAPPPPAVGSREGQEEGRQNAVIYETYRDRPLSEIRDSATSAWDRFTAALEACSEEDLMRPHPYAEGEVLWQTGLGIAYHTGEHLTYWYQESGETDRVEATQKWLRDIYVKVATDARSRANANYNLACFYARSGRVAEALPLLQDSFEGNEKLREWAKKDSDLDPIRDDPRVSQLVA